MTPSARQRTWLLVLRLCLAALLVAGSVGAQEAESLSDPEAEARAIEIANRTMSPFCPGRTLADCPSGSATAWRMDIRRMLKEGKSAKEIQDILSKRAGSNLSGSPDTSIGWALPVGILVGAIAILFFVFQRIKTEDAAETQKAKKKKKNARAAPDDDTAGDDELNAEEDEQALEARLRGEIERARTRA